MEKLVSIIVPVYKVEQYIRRCLDSVLVQTYSHFELILVDDGSPDDCPAICDEYASKDKRIKVIHKENGGVSSARNAGIDAAQSEYITFIDSDDWIEPDYIETLMANADDADYLCSGINCWIDTKNAGSNIHNIISGIKVDKKRGVVIRKEKDFCGNLSDNTKKFFTLFEKTIVLAPYAKIYKKSLIKDVKYILGVKKGQDVLFNIQYLQNCQTIKNISYAGYNYECRNAVSASKSIKRKDIQQIGKSYNEYLQDLQNVFGPNQYLNSIIVIDCFRSVVLRLKEANENKANIINALLETYHNYPKDKIAKSKAILLKNKIILFLIKHKNFRLLYNFYAKFYK